jgi:hypothetical protein
MARQVGGTHNGGPGPSISRENQLATRIVNDAFTRCHRPLRRSARARLRGAECADSNLYIDLLAGKASNRRILIVWAAESSDGAGASASERMNTYLGDLE